jgi:hypothetical protein
MAITARQAERLELKRQGMRGYAVLDGQQECIGPVRTSLQVAQHHASRLGGDVALVRTDGKLYAQRNGRALGPLIDPSNPARVLGVDLRASRRVRTLRASSGP